MSKYDELKRLAEAATPGPWSYDGSYICPARVEDETTYVETWRAVADSHQTENVRFIAAANPAVILDLINEVEALREKVSELNFDAARYCYLATTTWSDEVTDALCTSDKDQIDQAIDAELMRASA